MKRFAAALIVAGALAFGAGPEAEAAPAPIASGSALLSEDSPVYHFLKLLFPGLCPGATGSAGCFDAR